MYNAAKNDLLSIIQAQLASISNLISQQDQHGSPFQSQGQGASSSNYHGQGSSYNFEETVIALLEEDNKKNEA